MTCSGLYTALITPFNTQGKIDYDGFRLHIQRQKEVAVAGLVILGTTGEAATLTTQEKQSLIQIAREEAKNLPLIVGCGAYSTKQTIENILMASSCGADSALVVSPYYNKPTQEGLFRHFEEVCKASSIPILAYNNPGRTGVNIEIETLLNIANLPGMCGIKECSGSFTQLCELIYTTKLKNPHFMVFSGDDHLTLPIMALGGDGVISGAANLFPDKMSALTCACKNEEWEKARKLNLELFPLFKALLLESNPIPLKAAIALEGLPSGHPRLPLTPLNSKYLPQITQALKRIKAE